MARERQWTSLAGDRKVLEKVKNSFGSGTKRGSGEKLVMPTAAPKTTTGRASQRKGKECCRTKLPGQSSPANRNPRTKMICQASGLKNQLPSTGQVGRFRPKTRAAA